MDAFETLRRQAIVRREAAIDEARRKCQEIIRWVNKLEKQLVPPPPSKPEQKREAFCDALLRLMPKDREFTTVELFHVARKALPQRRLSVEKVRSSLAYLEESDRVRRIRLVNATIQWGGPWFVEKTKQWVQPTCAKEAEKVLRERGPLRILDLLVAIREAGFRADDDPRKVQSALARALCMNPRFKKVEGRRWGLVELSRT
jgi:hypothetical protein